MPAAVAQPLLNLSQPKAPVEIDKGVPNASSEASKPEKEFDQVLRSQQSEQPANEPREAASEPKPAADEVADRQQQGEQGNAQAQAEQGNRGDEQAESQPDSVASDESQLAQQSESGFVAVHHSLTGNISQIGGDVGALLPTFGKDLPLNPEQQKLITEQLQKLQPGQSLALSLDQGKLKLDVLDADGKLLSQETLKLSPQQSQQGLLGLQTGQVEIGKSEADQLLGLLQKSKGGDFQQELKQLLQPVVSTAASSTTSTSTASLNQANMSYRFVDGQLHASSQVPTQVGKPGWGEQVNQQVAWFSSKNISVAEIKLDPPDLGPLQVRVSNNGDQTTISFTSAHAQVRDALDQNLPRLREMLAEQGVDLADVDVGGEPHAEQEQEQEQQALADGESDGAEEGDVALSQEQVEAESAQLEQVGLGLVDERV